MTYNITLLRDSGAFQITVDNRQLNSLTLATRVLSVMAIYRQLTKGRRRFFLLAICEFDSDLIRAD
jgi:hypothetical protein